MNIDWNTIYHINVILKHLNDIAIITEESQIKSGIDNVSIGISNLAKKRLNETQIKELKDSLQKIDNLIAFDLKGDSPKVLKSRFMQENEELEYLEHPQIKLIHDREKKSIIETALLSDDPVVRQARPKMMILLGKTAALYSLITPLLIIICSLMKIETSTFDVLTKFLLWQGATIWGAFTTSFTGYTVARSADKRNLSNIDLGIPQSNLLRKLAKIGHKIS